MDNNHLVIIQHSINSNYKANNSLSNLKINYRILIKDSFNNSNIHQCNKTNFTMIKINISNNKLSKIISLSIWEIQWEKMIVIKILINNKHSKKKEDLFQLKSLKK